MAVPTFVTSSRFAVATSRSATALFVVSFLALASNVAVFVYQIITMVKYRRNPLKDELYPEHEQYQQVRLENLEVPESFEAHEGAASPQHA